MNTVKITRLQRLWRIYVAPRQPGTCVVCGCTETNACHNPDYGNCWWWDGNLTLCSHCAIGHIFTDPRTIHRVKDDNA